MTISERPAWVADTIFYQIFPDRFARSERVPKPAHLEPWDAPPTVDGYKGGDLLGVVERLDWLSDLGVSAVYLNPIFQSASNHRYHTHDYFRVDPLLGGDAAFDEMLAACHDRGIRVVLDGVFNHASRGFLQFNDILESGSASPYVDWFTIHEFPPNAYDASRPPGYDAWWNLHALPKFRTENPAVREFLMSVGEHWMRRGADGWRLDVPEEIKTEGFWEEFRQRVRTVNPDAYLVGEIWDPATGWIDDGTRFDGTMNYQLTATVLRFAAAGRIDADVVAPVNMVLEPPIGAVEYRRSIDRLLDLYPAEAQAANLNLLGSHDTARVLSMVGGDGASVRLASLLTFTFPGAPCIYYGDEIGLPGTQDPGSRAGFPWDDEGSWDHDLLAHFRSLSALRREHPALRHGEYRHVLSEGQAYAFAREHAGERLVVAINAGSGGVHPWAAEEGGHAEHLWGSGSASFRDGAMLFDLPPRSAGVWRVS